MLTRAEYMKGSEKLHQAYYLEIALEIGLMPGHLPVSVATIREKLKTDPNLNNVPLAQWDGRVSSLRGATAALKARGDFLSLGTGVCILKAYARHLAESGS